MPRIDPLQLLRTLSVLLSPKGGIKSGDEVVRLVQLMQKFSKKLVSKSIYIEILHATQPELLERFLNEKGWDLLNIWFADAVKFFNWPLCTDIMSLFVVCPMTAALLKDSADVNHAPKLINQLRVNQEIGDDIRRLANEVYVKWVAIVSPKSSEPEPVEATTKVSPLRTVRRNVRGGGATGRGRGGRSALRISSNDIIDDSDDSSVEEDDDDEDFDVVRHNGHSVAEIKKPLTVKIKYGNGVAQQQQQQATVQSEVEKDEPDAPINLLKSLAEEVSENLNKEKARKDKEALVKRRKSDEERKQKEKSQREKDKEREKEKEKKRKQQQQTNSTSSAADERERKRFRPDRRDEVNAEEKQRIKEKARLLKEEVLAKKDKETLNKISSTSTFSRIPKIPKKVVTPTSADESKAAAAAAAKDKALSFEAMLGGLDAKPKTVKTPMIKNKTAALLESFSKNKPASDPGTKHHHSSGGSSTSSSGHHHHHHHHHSSSSSKRDSSSSKKDKEKDGKKESSSSSSSTATSPSSRRHHDDKHKPPKLSISKRGSVDLESPKSGSGKNTSFSESTGFMVINFCIHRFQLRWSQPIDTRLSRFSLYYF